MSTVTRGVSCPYCGEVVTLTLDLSEPAQQYFEDCFVCCRPMLVRYIADGDRVRELDVCTENE